MSLSSGKSPRPMAEINVTPMVDVMLVLLIIFMITAPILAHQVDIDLPQRTPPDRIASVPPPPPIELRIVATGAMFWNGQTIVQEALEPQLRLEAGRKPQPELRVNADGATPYAVVADVLATAKRVRMKRIGFKNLSS